MVVTLHHKWIKCIILRLGKVLLTLTASIFSNCEYNQNDEHFLEITISASALKDRPTHVFIFLESHVDRSINFHSDGNVLIKYSIHIYDQIYNYINYHLVLYNVFFTAHTAILMINKDTMYCPMSSIVLLAIEHMVAITLTG